MMVPEHPDTPTLKIRVSCIVACDEELALIYRVRNGLEQWTLPGGNMELGEDVQSAMARELNEELGLTTVSPEFLFLQDMLIHRPDRSGLYRKLHVIFRVVIPPAVRAKIRTVEEDDLAVGQIRWVRRQELAKLHLYPGIAGVLGALPTLTGPLMPRLLPPLTDDSYSWR